MNGFVLATWVFVYVAGAIILYLTMRNQEPDMPQSGAILLAIAWPISAAIGACMLLAYLFRRLRKL